MRGKGPFNIEDLVRRMKLPFLAQVMNCPLPNKFWAPQIESFEGMKDPLDHLETYKTIMHL